MRDYYQDSKSEKLFQESSKFPKTQPNPHVRDENENRKIMFLVFLALVPALLFSGYLVLLFIETISQQVQLQFF